MKALLVLAVALAACPPKPPPPEPLPKSFSCADVCKREERLGCEAARPTAAGASCTEVCESVRESGVVFWDLGCRARAATCAAIDKCEEQR